MNTHNINYRFYLPFKNTYQPTSLILTLILTIYATNSTAQNLTKYHQAEKIKIDSILQFNKEKESLKWLSLAPTLSYSLRDQSLNIGVSLSNITNYIQSKQRNKIELERLKMQLNQKLEDKLLNLETQILDLKTDSLNMYMAKTNLDYYVKLLEIKEKQYKKNEITLEELLIAQADFDLRESILFIKQITYENKRKILMKKIN